MGRLFRNPKPAVYAIVAFVVLLVILWAIPSRADQTLALEGGSAMLRGETPVMGVTIGCPGCGPVGTDYEFGFDLIGESTHRAYNPNVIQVRAQLVDGWKRAELGLGFAYFNVEHEFTCRFTFHLMARYRFTDRLALQWRHSSSGSSCLPNTGRDAVTIGWRF